MYPQAAGKLWSSNIKAPETYNTTVSKAAVKQYSLMDVSSVFKGPNPGMYPQVSSKL